MHYYSGVLICLVDISNVVSGNMYDEKQTRLDLKMLKKKFFSPFISIDCIETKFEIIIFIHI